MILKQPCPGLGVGSVYAGEAPPNTDIGNNGATVLLTLQMVLSGSKTATINISGSNLVGNSSVGHDFWAVIDGNSSPPALVSPTPNAGGACGPPNQLVTALGAGYHTIALVYFTQALGLLGQHDTVVSAHIDVELA